jgi:hypothetical protein
LNYIKGLIGTIFRRRLILVLQRFKKRTLKLAFYIFCLFLCVKKQDVYKKRINIYDWKQVNQTTKPMSTQLNTKYTSSNAIQIIPEPQYTDVDRIQSLRQNEKRLSI